MSSTALRGALIDRSDLALRTLPPLARHLLEELHAPPRLAAHVRLVHDVAADLTTRLAGLHPDLPIDGPAVRFGAATHDIGKCLHIEELRVSGKLHEAAGHRVLLDLEIPPHLARFAGTHGTWSAPGRTLEDLLVSLADKTWKGHRIRDLEDLVVDRIALATGRAAWQVLLGLDEILEEITSRSDARIAFHTSFPIDP